MPLVLDYDDSWSRPSKRRRIDHPPDMARSEEDGHSVPSGGGRYTQNMPHQDTRDACQRPRAGLQDEIRTSDREELIQCIKRGQRPTWVPKPSLEALCTEANVQAQAEPEALAAKIGRIATPHADPSSLMSANPEDPIPRPPSALHAGDFHSAQTPQEEESVQKDPGVLAEALKTSLYSSSPPPWLQTARIWHTSHPYSEAREWPDVDIEQRRRSRAPSLGSSLSSSFVMRVPTSPLVHATSSPVSDSTEDANAHDDLAPSNKASRRRTLPTPPLLHMTSSLASTPLSAASSRHEMPTSFRAHQVRRSLTSFTYQPSSSAQSVLPSRHRRLSCASDASPRQRSSMIGSFEESILRGRMSTPPSRPLDFVAQIGVLGKGDCPARLKCPAHVSVTFPAVFYSYPSTTGSRLLSDDNPSPYVGTIDLAHNLKPVNGSMRRNTRSDVEAARGCVRGADDSRPRSGVPSDQDGGRGSPPLKEGDLIGGAYRVPQQGQLQVVVKNPNKTAVKLFLIPYDLQAMAPRTKTFVRQRSFSSGPIIENAISGEAFKAIQDPLSEKQILRYLIHLRFCCLGKGRYYLYDNIRIVFANRVPEGKEKLRNEVQLPEPKFSPLLAIIDKPSDKGSPLHGGPLSGSPDGGRGQPRSETKPSDDRATSPFSLEPIPFNFPPQSPDHLAATSHSEEILASRGQPEPQPQSLANSPNRGNSNRPQSPEVYGFDKSSTSPRASPVPWASLAQSMSRNSSPKPVASGDGLLSRKLRAISKKYDISTCPATKGTEQ